MHRIYNQWDFIKYDDPWKHDYKGVIFNVRYIFIEDEKQVRYDILWNDGVITRNWADRLALSPGEKFDLSNVSLRLLHKSNKYPAKAYVDNLTLIEILNDYKEYLNGKLNPAVS